MIGGELRKGYARDPETGIVWDVRKEKAFRNYDAAMRLYDGIRLHQTVLSKDEIIAKRYMAVRIADGGSDNTAYESHADAVDSARNQPFECFYPQIPLDGIDPIGCDVMIWYAKAVYAAGHRSDPARQLILPTRVEDLNRVARGRR